MDDSVKTIAANVRRLRAARGLSAAGLARASGVARATLAELEAGRGNPTVETLYGLASVLGVTLADLLVEAEAPAVHVVRAGEGPRVSGAVLQARLLRQAAVENARVEMYELHVLPGRPRRADPHQAGRDRAAARARGAAARAGPSTARSSSSRATSPRSTRSVAARVRGARRAGDGDARDALARLSGARAGTVCVPCAPSSSST